MIKIFTITKSEFYRYFISPLAYVYLVCFLLINSSFTLYFGGLFTLGNAYLKPMFDFLPWIYLLFIPGISMRLWAEEFKSGTILQITTLPIPINSFIWGKFFAAWAFCGLGLLLTFPFVITLNILGNPDNLTILNSYIGAFLLSGAMLAISQTASALTKNQVIALVLSVFFNLIFMLSGLEYVLDFFRNFSPDYVIDLISSFSFLTHMTLFSTGVFQLYSIVFFVSLILVFNFFTLIIIDIKTLGNAFWLKAKSLSGYFYASILIFISFTGINLFANGVLKQINLDFTEDKIFTLSSSSRNILQNLPSPTTAKIYYSPILGQRNPQMRLAFDKLKTLLETYKNISDNKFDYQIYNPEPLSNIEDQAITSGIQAIPLNDMNAAAYFGITIINENGYSRTIPFLPLERLDLIEQDLTENIYLLEHKKKTLGVLTSLPIFGTTYGNITSQPWQIASEINKFYKTKIINTPNDLDNVDILMIAHPQNITKEMEDAIYNFSTNGGKILAFFDTAPEALLLTGPQTSILHQSDFGSLPAKWGFHFFDNLIVADLDNSSKVTIDTAEYSAATEDLIQFYLTPENFFANLPQTTNLKRMLLTSASSFTPINDANIFFIPLIQASKQSQFLSAKYITQRIHPAEILRNFKSDNKPKYLAAHIISKQKDKPFELIVIGDSDLLYDSFWSSSIRVGGTDYNIPLFDNSNFVLNALDSLIGNNTFTDLRGKSLRLRSFKSLEQKQKQIQVQFKIKEKDIFDQINLIKKGLNEITNKRIFENRETFTPDELSIINKTKKELEKKRQDLYFLRLALNDNLQKTELLVKIFNIYTIPSIIILVFLLFKSKKIKVCIPQKPKFNKNFAVLCIFSSLCLILGVIGIVLQPSINKQTFEGLPTFPSLEKEINNINKIKIQNSNHSLEFIKKDGTWQLSEHPTFLVNQNRIKNFLITLIQSTIYEKKADKLENLSRFGLLPLSDPKSKTTFIELYHDNKNILSFEVGKYNIELARGLLGAYIRNPNKFEVWLATADFISLDTNPDLWTYSSLWNLQFGRFTLLNGKKDIDKIAKVASIMLNTKLINKTNKPISTPDFSLVLQGEEFDKLTLNFYKQNSSFIVQYIFEGSIKKPLLQKIATHFEKNFYLISTNDAEKIKDVLK